jgi:hypothetical protein
VIMGEIKISTGLNVDIMNNFHCHKDRCELCETVDLRRGLRCHECHISDKDDVFD